MRRYYDITLPFSPRLPAWPGEPKPVVERLSSIANGDAANVSRIDGCVHYGTHMDAPAHFIDGGNGIEQLVSTLKTVDMRDRDSGRAHATRRKPPGRDAGTRTLRAVRDLCAAGDHDEAADQCANNQP